MIQKRNTWQKSAVIDQLNKTDGFLSAQQLHQRIEKTGQKLGLTTVYRALTELVEQGIADGGQRDAGQFTGSVKQQIAVLAGKIQTH